MSGFLEWLHCGTHFGEATALPCRCAMWPNARPYVYVWLPLRAVRGTHAHLTSRAACRASEANMHTVWRNDVCDVTRNEWFDAKIALQECPTRMSYKSARTVSHRSVLTAVSQMSSKSVLQECPTRVGVPQECPTREELSYKCILQEGPITLSRSLPARVFCIISPQVSSRLSHIITTSTLL